MCSGFGVKSTLSFSIETETNIQLIQFFLYVIRKLFIFFCQSNAYIISMHTQKYNTANNNQREIAVMSKACVFQCVICNEANQQRNIQTAADNNKKMNFVF